MLAREALSKPDSPDIVAAPHAKPSLRRPSGRRQKHISTMHKSLIHLEISRFQRDVCVENHVSLLFAAPTLANHQGQLITCAVHTIAN